MSDNNKKLNRRQFLKMTGIGSASAVAMLAMKPFDALAKTFAPQSAPRMLQEGQNMMTYRVNRHSGDKVSLLGYGMITHRD